MQQLCCCMQDPVYFDTTQQGNKGRAPRISAWKEMVLPAWQRPQLWAGLVWWASSGPVSGGSESVLQHVKPAGDDHIQRHTSYTQSEAMCNAEGVVVAGAEQAPLCSEGHSATQHGTPHTCFPASPAQSAALSTGLKGTSCISWSPQ